MASAKIWSFFCKTCTSEYSNTALPGPVAGLRGPYTSKGKGRAWERRGRGGGDGRERKGRGGAGSSLRKFLDPPLLSLSGSRYCSAGSSLFTAMTPNDVEGGGTADLSLELQDCVTYAFVRPNWLRVSEHASTVSMYRDTSGHLLVAPPLTCPFRSSGRHWPSSGATY